MDRRTKNWLLALALFVGVPALVIATGQTHDAPATQDRPASPATETGPWPDRADLQATVLMVLRHEAGDPDSVQVPEMGDPVADKRDGVSCWRVPFRYRAKNSFGALVRKPGVVWAKDGKAIHLSCD